MKPCFNAQTKVRTTTFDTPGVKVIRGRIGDKDSEYNEYTTTLTITGGT